MIQYAITNGVKYAQTVGEHGVWITDHIDDARLYKRRSNAQTAIDAFNRTDRKYPNMAVGAGSNLTIVEVEVTRNIVSG